MAQGLRLTGLYLFSIIQPKCLNEHLSSLTWATFWGGSITRGFKVYKRDVTMAVNNFPWPPGVIEGGSRLQCLCCVCLPVPGRRRWQRRTLRPSQRKPRRNSRRKQRKLQKKAEKQAKLVSGVFFFFLSWCVSHPLPPFTAGKTVLCVSWWALWFQQGCYSARGSRATLSIVHVFLPF